MRRGVGLRLDRDGQWHHRGEPIRHRRLGRALHEGIDRHPQSGEYVVRLGAQWCYIEVEDAPYQVEAAAPDPAGIRLRLSDGRSEMLDPSTLHLGAEGFLYAQVRDGAFPARFSRQAFHALAPFLVEEEGRAVLLLEGRRFPLGEVGG